MAVRSEPAAVAATAGPGSLTLTLRALRRQLTVYRRIWRSSVYSSVLGPLLYLGAMGFGLGPLVNRNGTASLGGVPYLAFVAPAILAMQAMQTAMSESTFPVYSNVHWNKGYLAARATPLRPGDLYRAQLLYIALRLVMNSAVFMVIMAGFGTIRSAWAAAALPAAVLTGLAFAAPVAAWAVTVRKDSTFNYALRFGMTPLMLFSGTFFPLSKLPGWARPVAYATPLWHGVALCRSLTLGAVDAGSAAIHLAYLLGVGGIGVWAGARTFTRRLHV